MENKAGKRETDKQKTENRAAKEQKDRETGNREAE